MKLYPNDLGGNRTTSVILHRLKQRDSVAAQNTAPVGFWSKLWIGRKNREADPAIVRVAMSSLGFALGTVLLATIPGSAVLIITGTIARNEWAPGAPLFMLGSVGMIAGAYAIPSCMLRRRLHRVTNKPLTAMEVASLLPAATDDLIRAYLTLVMDVVRQDVEPLGGADLRSALRALGEAIDKLPATRAIGIDSPDIMTEVLRRTAEETLKQAQVEPDRIVGASLIRRAESLHRRADATSRANLLSRRFMVLRQEMAAETEALRAGLAAYYTGAHDIADLTRLAHDVQRVAAEAAAITQATEEVDEALLERPSYRPAIAEPTAMHIQSGLG